MANQEIFTKRLKDQIINGLKEIRIKDQISGLTYGELAITSLDGDLFIHQNLFLM